MIKNDQTLLHVQIDLAPCHDGIDVVARIFRHATAQFMRDARGWCEKQGPQLAKTGAPSTFFYGNRDYVAALPREYGLTNDFRESFNASFLTGFERGFVAYSFFEASDAVRAFAPTVEPAWQDFNAILRASGSSMFQRDCVFRN